MGEVRRDEDGMWSNEEWHVKVSALKAELVEARKQESKSDERNTADHEYYGNLEAEWNEERKKILDESTSVIQQNGTLRQQLATVTAERERHIERDRASDAQLVWLSAWCKKRTGIENNAVIHLEEWPSRLVEVVAKAIDEKTAALEAVVKFADHGVNCLVRDCGNRKRSCSCGLNAALSSLPKPQPAEGGGNG